jgi:hypothetical protein|nr:MAG TPA: hypothetical protein [Caudoviricetes sp.]
MTNDQMKETIERAVTDLNTLGTLLDDLGVYQISINAPTITTVSSSTLDKMESTPKFIFEASILAYAMEKLPFFDRKACKIRPYGRDSFQAALEFGGIFFVCILSYDQAIKMFPERVRRFKDPESEIIEFDGKRFRLIEENPADDLGES